jgi:adenosylhomocysteine nucleosidase
MGPLLVVASEPREFLGLLRRCRGIEELDWPVRFARSAELNGRRLLLVAHGHGPRLAGEAADAGGGQHVEGLLSTGSCGALSPALRPGDTIAATRVETADGRSFVACLPRTGRQTACGPVISLDRVVRTADEKRRLHARGFLAVEMEAAAVAERAARWGVPFYCLRAVTDTAQQDLMIDLNAARDDQGQIRDGRVVVEALRRPWSLPELFILWRRSHVAAESIGQLIVDSRF